MNILVVDDNSTNRKLLRANLESENFCVDEVEDGVEALELLDKKDFDCVITDILMPQMDGYSLCYQIRNTGKLSKIPVIIYTSTHFSPSDKILAMQVGADKFIEKPAPFNEMLEAIKQIATEERFYRQRHLSSPKEYELTKQYSELLVRKLEEKNQELVEKEKEFRQLAENIREIFYILDPHAKKIIFVSPAYEEVWGEPCESLYTDYNSWTNSIHEDDKERVVESFAAGKKSGNFQEEYRIVRPNGESRWVFDRAFPVLDDEGNLIRLVGIAEDITERKALEAQLLQMHKIEALGRLAGGIAHDFNNFLSIIQGYTEMISKSVPADSPLQNDLEEVKHATDLAVSLTKQLLLFSRQAKSETKLVDLNEIISKIVNMIRRVIGENIELDIRSSDKPRMIKADPGQIEQVILNLAINARDAMVKGGKLLISTAEVNFGLADVEQVHGLTPGEYVMLEISDTGCGMSPDVKAHLFEPFFSTKGEGKGTGLGLATCYGIVKRAGGAIWVDSYKGNGTTFKLFFPKAVEIEEKSTVIEKKAVLQGGKETILLTEDEPLLRKLTSRILKSYGYTVIEAASGEDALKIARENFNRGIQLLLSDLVLPRMNGRELAGEIVKLIPRIKILLASGYSESPRNGEEFIQKPFSEEILLRKVREIFLQKAA